MTLPINPQTKVGALLEAYPGIDEVLIGLAPAFAKLKNPVLRKTVAKIATLDQAAKIGGVSARELVTKLREATGHEALEVLDDPAAGAASGEAPSWLDEKRVYHTIDADAMLETGVHPIGEVRRRAAGLEPGDILKLTSAFRPEPLIATMEQAGIAVYSIETAPGRHATYFTRPVS